MRTLSLLAEHLRACPSEPLPPQLAADLRQALTAIEAGAEPGTAFQNGDRHRGLSALHRAAELLAPAAGAWGRAGALAVALAHFRSTAWPRIRSGAREPSSELEAALSVASECGDWPGSQRRLYEALRRH